MICKWAEDSQRLILENFDTIQDSPSRIYHEAVPFSPSSSWLHEWYTPELLQGVKVAKGLQARWGRCSRTVLFDSVPSALACWKNLIVAGMWSGHIITLDATTGICTSTLYGHTDLVRSLAFSSDGTSLVSGSEDRTVRLWDIQTGGVVRIFHGHTHWISSVSISSDQTTIASGSCDMTIRLWNTQTGQCHCVIDGLSGIPDSVSFSPTNSQHLMSASQDNTVQQWDINGYPIGPAYAGYYATFSPDGIHFISWGKGVIMVWNSNSGVIVTKCQVPSGNVGHCCFSPNGKLVAGASYSTIYIWDITSSDPHPIETLVGHTHVITSLVFSSILISSSHDRSIKFWQINASSTNPLIADSEPNPLASTSIMTLSVQAKDHIAISSDKAGVVRTWDLSTGLCKSSIKTSAGPLSRRDIKLIDGRLLIVWCTREKIHIWDTQKGKHPRKVDAKSEFSTTSVKISGDGSTVFLLDREHIQALSTQTGEVVGKVRMEGELSDNPLIVDGLRVWVHFKDLPTQGWDFGVPGSISIGPFNAPLASPRLEFICGMTKLTTVQPPRVKDTFTGKEIFQLPRRYQGPTNFCCDGQYLVTGYKSGELLILDFCQMIS